jgi:hypothetical protein
MLDPIDSSTGSHQDKGNSDFIDLIDPTFDYLPDQLRFFLNQLRLRCRQCSISDSYHIRTMVDSLKSDHSPDWLCVTSGHFWSFTLVEDTSNRLHAHSDYHSVLKDEVTTNQNKVWKIFWRKLSYPPTRYQRMQAKNWSYRVIFSYWTHHQPHDIGEEGSRTRRWSKYYVEKEVAQLGSNRGSDRRLLISR